MRKVSQEELAKILEKHKKWLDDDPDGERADLSGANLSGANIDYSSLPLWCGSLSAKFDDRQIKQIAYHLVKAGLNSKNTSEETKRQLRKIVDLANGFHRASECGKIIITNEEVS